MFTRAEIRKAVWDTHVVNDRTDLSKDLEAWFGKKTTHIGLQFVDLGKDGRLVKGRYIDREDVACFQVWGKANVFLHFDREGGPEWSISIQPWADEKDKDVTLRDERMWEAEITQWIAANDEFVAHHRRWFRERPYKHIVGMTPVEGSRWLVANGWPKIEWKMAPPPNPGRPSKPMDLVDDGLRYVAELHSAIYNPDDTRPAEPMLAELERIFRELRLKPALRR